MAGVVLDTLSLKKLIILGLLLLFLFISFFLIGGLIAPNPSSVIHVLGTKCVNTGGLGNKEWFIPRGSGPERCIQYDNLDDPRIEDDRISANQIVFAFWMPHIRDGRQLDFSRWQQTMIAVLQLEIIYDDKVQVEEDATIQLDARIGYRNKNEDVNDWKELANSLETRQLNCKMEGKIENGYAYDCDLLSFFELGSIHYDYYLVNIKVPVEPYKGINTGIGMLRDIVLVHLCRMMRTLFSLGIAMSVLNCPLEWFTLAFNMPYMLLITDIRQGGFYAMLLSFWIIFTGEHIMDQTERNRLVLYWKHLLAVVIGCFCLLLFELSERGVQLTNPFFSIWVTEVGFKLALSFIITAAIAAAIYFFFLCYMIFLVFRNISAKKRALPSTSNGRQLYYKGLIYRFKFLMLTTLVCAALTVVFFIISQLNEGQWKWGDEGPSLEYNSAFFTGVYGMWNVYVIGLLSLYAPSHKQFAPEYEGEPADFYLGDLLAQLSAVVAAKPSERINICEDEAEDPASIPIYWVSEWVDYSDKYGTGYQLCDDSVGVLFDDSTQLILLANGDNVQYIERDGTEHFHTLKVFPESLTKKVTLLKDFRNYMSEHLSKAGANITPRESDDTIRLPFLRTWFRTGSAIVLHLSNGTLQINFSQDHTKVILCPLTQAVTYIDEKQESRVFKFSLIEKYGCSKELAGRIGYAKTMVEQLITSKSGSGLVR